MRNEKEFRRQLISQAQGQDDLISKTFRQVAKEYTDARSKISDRWDINTKKGIPTDSKMRTSQRFLLPVN